MSIEIDLVALKAAAEAAGGDAWTSDQFGEVVWGADGDGVAIAYHCMGHQPEALNAADIATHIAAANPAVVLALIERLQVAEAKAKARVKLYISPKECMPEQQLTAYRIYGAV